MKKLVKIIGVLALAALLVFVLDIGCMFRSLTGFPCLGCGTTRACLAFLQGHVVDAFYYHPLFWLSVILIIVTLFRGGTVFRSEKANRWFWITIFLMYLTVYIVRMVLLFPDVPPMDYNYGAPLYRVYQWLASLFAN
jgi:cytochrome bd-type quinol oxidase subunit 2